MSAETDLDDLYAIARRLRVRAEEGSGIARTSEKRIRRVEFEGAAGEALRDAAQARRRRAESVADEMEELAAYLMRYTRTDGAV